jgi:thiol-disulfide isomerase/thioredoxin
MESTELGVPVEVIDVDEDSERAVQYGIRGVPTLILIDDTGVEVKRKVGMMSADDLTKFASHPL